MAQLTAVVLCGIGVTAFLLLGLAPVTLFFVLTSENYAFFQLLAVVFVTISGCVGLYYLWAGIVYVNSDVGGRFDIFGRVLLIAWIVLYAFVGSQMTWRLSPFIADPTLPFTILQPSRDNFYIDVFSAFERVSGIAVTPQAHGIGGGLLVGFMLTVAFVVGIFVGRQVCRKSRPPVAKQHGVLDDVALKAKYAPHGG
jgi:hypothetical protein